MMFVQLAVEHVDHVGRLRTQARHMLERVGNASIREPTVKCPQFLHNVLIGKAVEAITQDALVVEAPGHRGRPMAFRRAGWNYRIFYIICGRKKNRSRLMPRIYGVSLRF